MKRTISRGATKIGLAVAAAVMVTSANAASVTWNFQNQAGLPTQSFTDTVSGVTITMRAYSTVTNANLSNTWSTAQFNNQGNAGLGMTHSGESTNAPDHAI